MLTNNMKPLNIKNELDVSKLQGKPFRCIQIIPLFCGELIQINHTYSSLTFFHSNISHILYIVHNQLWCTQFTWQFKSIYRINTAIKGKKTDKCDPKKNRLLCGIAKCFSIWKSLQLNEMRAMIIRIVSVRK